MLSPPEPTSRKRLAWATLGLAASTTLALGLYGTHSSQFQTQHHTSRLLSQLSSTSGIRFSVSTKAADSALDAITMNGIAIPRRAPSSDADTVLEFDGRMSYEFMNREFNLTLVDGRGYSTIADTTTGEVLQNNCLQPGSIMPIHTITDALKGARVVDDGSAFGVTHCEGTLLELQFANEPYLMCSPDVAGPFNGTANEIHGDDVMATFEFLRTRNAVSVADEEDGGVMPPTVESLTRPGGKSLTECPLLTASDGDADLATEDTASSSAMVDNLSKVAARAQDVATVLSGGSRRLGRGCDSSCKGGMKTCLFVHGLGKKLDDTLADSYDDAWGDVETKMKCCSQTKFIRMDTVTNPWYSDVLARKVCDAAVGLSKSRDPMNLENIVILAHSMGNLVLANAAMKNMCAVGPSAKWIALAPPTVGSTAANLAVNLCGPNPAIIDKPLVATLQATGLCPDLGTVSSIAYRGDRESTRELDALYGQAEAMFARYVTASMCGIDSVGLPGQDSVKYGALDVVAGHASGDNDGAVEFASCRGPRSANAFSTSWKDGAFYMAFINHGDATGRNGDGWWGDDRKPIKWINCQF